MLRKIKSFKLDLESRYPEITFDELDQVGNTDHRSLAPEGKNRMVHDDLVNALQATAIHLAARTEQHPFTDMDDNPELLKKFKVTGFTIGGKDEHEGVVLIGQRVLENNAVLNLVMRFTKFHPTHSDYVYIGSMTELIQNLFKEIDQYIIGDKRAPEAQLDMFDEAAKDKPAKKERKKKGLKEVVEDLQEEGIEIKMAVNH